MANIVSTLLVELSANTAKFVSGMDKASASLKTVQNSLSFIKYDAIINLGERAFQAGERVYEFARSVASSANEIKRQSEIMGLSTDTYQKLAYAAKMADVGSEQFATGMKFLARSIEEAKAGTGDAEKWFSALGIDINLLSDDELKLEAMTYRLAEAFKSTEQGTGKTAVAIGLMGRSGQEMVPYMNLGADAIKNLGEEAVKMGSILGDVIITKGSEAEDIFKHLEVTINATKISLAPAANAVANFFKEALEAGKMFFTWIGKLPGLDFAKAFGEDIVKTVPAIEKGMEDIKKVIDLKQFADPEGIKRAQRLIHEWLAEYRVDITELNDAMGVLGTQSTEALIRGIKDSQVAVAAITAQFKSGKASILDYGNAIQELRKKYEDLTGVDVTKKLVDLEERTSEAMKAVDKNLPDWQKQMAKITDAWIKERNEIQEKSPAFIRANLTKWEEDLREAKARYDAFAASLVPVEIMTGGSNATGVVPGAVGNMYETNMGRLTGGQADTNLNVKLKFWGEGMSPPMPLGEAFDKLGNRISQTEADMNGLSFAVDFSQTTASLGDLGNKINAETEAFRYWMGLISSTWASANTKLFGMNDS